MMYMKLNARLYIYGVRSTNDGEIFEIFVTTKHDREAALSFMTKALKRHGSPEGITTDGLALYTAAMNTLCNTEKQVVVRWANNRARTAIFSSDESGRDFASDKGSHYRRSPQLMPTSDTTATWSATSSTDRPLRIAARPHWLSGMQPGAKGLPALPSPLLAGTSSQ